MRRLALGLLGACLLASAVSAHAPASSLRPVARGEVHPGVITSVNPRTIGVEPKVDRPDKTGLFQSLRPRLRPERVQKRASQTYLDNTRGSVCGDPAILGERAGQISGKVTGCGIDQAVRVRAVSGVTLSTPALIDCTTAKALKLWTARSLKPTVGRRGGGVKEMRIFASYACRTRNSKKGARISEHGKGRAVDIGVFKLRDGSEISVLKDWGRGKKGRILRDLHKDACGPFGTVLGPNADKYHRDHFHFDTARYRSGSYCR